MRLIIASMIIVALSLGCASGRAMANPPLDFEALSRLDLVDLAQVQVTVASKREEQLADAPGVVSVITQREIHALGATNLIDILNRAPGLQAIGSHFYPHSISIRGQMFAHSNNDVQFLINGRPHRTSWNGGTPERLLLSFPVFAIERIEIIRGPGSVLYGTGAFSGVIDIITRSAEDLRHGYGALTYGSQDSVGLEAASGAVGKSGDVAASVRGFLADGWDFTATDEAGVTDTAERGQEDFGALLTGHRQRFSVNALYTDVELNTILGGPPAWPAGTHTTRHLFLDVGYSAPVSTAWRVDSHVTYNDFGLSFVDTPPVVQERDSEDVLFELTLDGALRDNLHVLLGGTYEDLRGTISADSRYSSDRASLYAQADYDPAETIKLTFGLQWNKVEQTASDVLPRISLVSRLTSHWGTKLLYGEAFRSAVATERFLSTPTLLGNPSVKPERIATAEGQIFYTADRYFAAMTYFQSEITDLIDRVALGSGQFMIANQGEIDSRGAELEGKIKLNRSLELLGSAGYQENENANGLDASLAPSFMAKLGMIYDGAGRFTLGIFNSYFEQPTPVSEVNPAVAQVNPQPDGYHVLTAQMRFNLQRLLQLPGTRPLTVGLYGDNLLDEEIYYPEFNRRNINAIPIAGGRALYATFEIGI